MGIRQVLINFLICMLKLQVKDNFKLKANWKFTRHNVITGKDISNEYTNAITSNCYNMIMRRFAGEANDCNITYIAVGTGTFPGNPSESTTLVTENARNLVTSITASGNQINVIGYFGLTQAIATLTEAALFGEAATASANSGTMINHAAISEAKTNAETLTIEVTIQKATS